MKFKVVLYETEEGFSVFCPGLPGCLSEGDSKEEALENIQEGIREFLEVIWEETNQEIAKDLAEHEDLSVSMAEVDVDVAGVEQGVATEAKV